MWASEVEPFVKRRRPRAIGEEGRCDILHLTGYMRLRNSLTRGRKTKDIAGKVAKMLGRRKGTVQQVWREFLLLKKVVVRRTPTNRVTGLRRARVPRSPVVRGKVQAFLREQREKRVHVSAITLCDFLQREGIINFDSSSRKARRAAQRAVQRYVKKLGFKRGTKKGELGYKLSEKNEAHLLRYLRFMQRNRNLPVGQRRRIVSQDESYIHENYRRTDSLFDPEDEEDRHRKGAPPGRRFCFIGATLGPDLNVPEAERTDEQRGRFLMPSLDVFLGGTRKRSARKRARKRLVSSATKVAELREFATKLGLSIKSDDNRNLTKKQLWALLLEHEKEDPEALMPLPNDDGGGADPDPELPPLAYNGKFNHQKSKETKDYHGMFNHHYMVQWMVAFLESLAEDGIENVVIVMDNAKYHKRLPAHIPKYSAPKAEILDALRSLELPFDEAMAKPELVLILKRYVEEHVDFVLVEMVQEAGHELIFSPPHYSDLQPIEIVWALAKGAVGRQYSLETKIGDTYDRLLEAFAQLGPDQIDGCYRKTLKQELVLIEHYRRLEMAEAAEAEEAAAASGSSDDESSSSATDSSATDSSSSSEDSCSESDD